jgi:hypothetical protein
MPPKLTYYNLSADRTPVEISGPEEVNATADWFIDQTLVPLYDPVYKIHTGFIGYDGDMSPWIKGQKRAPKCFRTRITRLENGEEVEEVSTVNNETYDDASMQHRYSVRWCQKMWENDAQKAK